MLNVTIKSFLASLAAVSLVVMPQASLKIYTYPVEAKPAMLAFSVLEVKETPYLSDKDNEKVAKDDKEGESSPSGIKELIQREFGKEWRVMYEVARCESTLRHYVNGEVLRGEQVKEDVGLFQINETYWLEKSRKLGIDIYDLEGNIKMARYIYEHGGLNHWSASAPCWLKKGDLAN